VRRAVVTSESQALLRRRPRSRLFGKYTQIRPLERFATERMRRTRLARPLAWPCPLPLSPLRASARRPRYPVHLTAEVVKPSLAAEGKVASGAPPLMAASLADDVIRAMNR